MGFQKNIIPGVLALTVLVACKEKYEPPVVKTDQNLLVVDGFLNNSSDTTTIRLSRTRKLADGPANSTEKNSQVMLEDESGVAVYNFQETDNGNYIVPGLSLDNNKKYKLRINTSDGKQYVSDEIVAKPTPPIDSITWKIQNNALVIFVNTHDPQNETRYYRWDYTDTWEYHSLYYSYLRYQDSGMILYRNPDEFIYQCWTTRNSTALLLGSSARLTDDVIYMSPLRSIPVNSIELQVKYSILVRQFALSKDEYDYLQNLKKITEQLGSIFDAQPSQLTGNIHSLTDPAETVLGFISASSVNEKRIFITNEQVRPWDFHYHCADKIIVPFDSLVEHFGDFLLLPVSEAFGPTGRPIGYTGGTADCVDCRLSGGNTKKPDFWP